MYGEIYNLEAAIRYNREGAEASYKVGDPEIIRNAEINLGDDYLLLGDLEQAQRYLEKVYRDTQQRGQWGEEWMKWRYSQHLYHSLGELWLTKGDAAQALEFAEECLKLAEPTMSRKNLVKGWRLKGQALLAQGQGEQAEAALVAGADDCSGDRQPAAALEDVPGPGCTVRVAGRPGARPNSLSERHGRDRRGGGAATGPGTPTHLPRRSTSARDPGAPGPSRRREALR